MHARVRITMRLGVTLLAFATNVHAQQVVTGTIVSTKEVTWRIERPAVNQPTTPYPEIKFSSKDLVRVEAGGCVQTGGFGSTWKLYVGYSQPDASADEAALFHGTITIPGALNLPPNTPIANALNKDIQLGEFPEGTEDLAYLSLGYIDQEGHYSDNSYDGHDDGTHDQCKDIGSAYVVIHRLIGQGSGQPDAPSASLDLWWNSLDHNLLPLNPLWGKQVTNHQNPDAEADCGQFITSGDSFGTGAGSVYLGDPPCTTNKVLIDEPTPSTRPFEWLVCGIGSKRVHGHVNWSIASYTGTMYFVDWQAPFDQPEHVAVGDNDYDFSIVRNDEAGVTAGNKFKYREVGPTGLDVEFDAGEVIDSFTTQWWTDFRNAVRSHPPLSGDWTGGQGFIDGNRAIAIGLLGIDTQHGAHSELHPLYGLALQADATPEREVWQVFARNWGNEGFCSQNQHFAPLQALRFFFGKNQPDETITVDTAASTLMGNLNGMVWRKKDVSNGVIVEVVLGAPESRPMAHGQIVLHRTSSLNIPREDLPLPLDLSSLRRAERPEKEAESSEEVDSNIDVIASSLDAIQMKGFRSSLIDRYRQKTQSVTLARTAISFDATQEASAPGRAMDPRERRAGLYANPQIDPAAKQRSIEIFSNLITIAGGRDQLTRALQGSFVAKDKKQYSLDTWNENVAGTVVAVSDDSLTITANNRQMSFRIADDAAVQVRTDSPLGIRSRVRDAEGKWSLQVSQIIRAADTTTVTFIDYGYARVARRIDASR